MPRAVPAAAPPMTSFADGIRAASSPPGWTEPVRSHSVDLEELPGWARALLDSERVGHLAFLDEADLPRVLAVTFAVWEGAVWSAIDRKPKPRSRARLSRWSPSPHPLLHLLPTPPHPPAGPSPNKSPLTRPSPAHA